METLLVLLAFPLVWPFVAKRVFHTTITWPEMGINVVVSVLLTSAVYFAGNYSQTRDVEIWNGFVTGKASERVSCEHSYSCNCREICSGTGSSRSCSTYCETCYEHWYDVDWRVFTNLGKNHFFLINRVNRQGTTEPPRWTAVANGDPVADDRPFTNYIKAVPESLFNEYGSLIEKYKDSLPAYPSRVYDYHYVDRVIPVGVEIPNLKEWNRELALTLRGLGATKQANVVVVITSIPSPEYADALREAWIMGKKNDTVVVVGTHAFPEINWVRVFSWSKNDMHNVWLRDAIQDLKTLEVKSFMTTVMNGVNAHFERRSMEEYAYLEDEIDPPTWVIILAVLVAVGSSLGLTYVFHKNEIA